MECSSGSKYFPSYDRQRAREFKKQNPKLTSLEHEQAVKQEQLAQMSQDILMQELLGAENNLRLKLQAVEEQVIQQHAYLMQLRHNQSDAVQIAREQLVEQHLLKRQVKFYDKLSKLLENKTKLQCALSPDRDISSSVCGRSSRISMDNTVGQFKHGKGCQTCLMLEEQDQQKDSLLKFDNEKFSLKPKQLDISESMSPEKIRELKQRLKLQSETLFEMSSGQCQNAFDIHQVQSTNSVDSNRSLRGNECIHSFVGSHLENNMASENECYCDQSMVHPSMESSRTGLYSKDKSYFANFRNTDQHVKNVPEYQVSGYKENFDNDARQMKSSGFNRPESTKRPENGSENGYSMPNSILPYQQGLSSSVLFRQEDMANNPTQQQSDVLIESPTLNGSRPIEVRSFHDPHHSHKFALDDMPTESSLLSNTTANSMDSLNNKNNSYIFFVHSINNQYQHSFNYNSNAITDTVEGFETNTENGNLTHISEHQFQPSLIVECSMISNNSTTTCATEDATVCASDKVFIEDSSGPEIHSQNITDSGCSNKEINIAETVINNFDEELTISPKQHNILLNTAANHDLFNKSDASLHALVHGHGSKSVNIHDTFKTCGFPSHKHDSAQSHLFELERDIIGASLSPEASPCKKCCLISSAQHKSEDHHMTPPQKSRLEMSWKRKCSILSDLRSGMKQVTDAKNMWSPSIENASSAGERNGLLYAPSVFLSFGDRIYGDNNNWKTYTSLYSQNGLDSFDLKLAKYGWDKQMEDDDDDDDDNEEYDENLSRDDSFFYQPVEEKLRALTPEEREKMYILTVAAEKSRVV